ncbi:MAG: GNAT family N-acetyltransferase [Anaerolineales bacterium]|nr:GNAT family N-acetyltransferase [Anaerolineales bacterium]
MTVSILPERPDGADARALIAELDAYLIPLYPPASHHGYPVEKLIAEKVVFFIVRVDGAAAGCGGLKFYEGYAELKRMYMRPFFRGRGLGRALLNHLERHAASRGAAALRLETGILQHGAIGLYESLGYREIEAFGEYQPDPLSRFYEKQLIPSADA